MAHPMHEYTNDDYARTRFNALQRFFLRNSNHAKNWEELTDEERSFFVRTQALESKTTTLAYTPPTLTPSPSVLPSPQLIVSIGIGIGLAIILFDIVGAFSSH